MDANVLSEMNQIFSRMTQKHDALMKELPNRLFRSSSGWYPGIFRRDSLGNWTQEIYPMPVITVKNICDIQIGFDLVTISTLLSRDLAIGFPFELFREREFNAYGLRNRHHDFYHSGKTFQDLRDNARMGNEREIVFSFPFAFAAKESEIIDFVKFLRREGFYR